MVTSLLPNTIQNNIIITKYNAW